MTLEQLEDEVEAYLNVVYDFKIEEDELAFIVHFVHAENFLQLLYDFGIDITLAILKMLEDLNHYEQCAKIKKMIELTNKREGLNYATRYEDN